MGMCVDAPARHANGITAVNARKVLLDNEFMATPQLPLFIGILLRQMDIGNNREAERD